MTTLVFLPATDTRDSRYGVIPISINGYPDFNIRTVNYPTLVWYNGKIQREAVEQIRSWNLTSIVLVGFSKSGLGAWNIARQIPELISGTIIFDAPVARIELPGWETQLFYSNDEEWQKDLPIRSIDNFYRCMPKSHKLVLISGPSFHSEMVLLSEALTRIGNKHSFLDRSDTKHHWNSGWIEEAMKIFANKN